MDYTHMGYGLGMGIPAWSPAIILVLLWSLVWKGLALWHAGRRGDAVWFVVLLVVNTLGILEIIYLLFFAKLKVNELFSKNNSSKT